jgi:hypothetical protein
MKKRNTNIANFLIELDKIEPFDDSIKSYIQDIFIKTNLFSSNLFISKLEQAKQNILFNSKSSFFNNSNKQEICNIPIENYEEWGRINSHSSSKDYDSKNGPGYGF